MKIQAQNQELLTATPSRRLHHRSDFHPMKTDGWFLTQIKEIVGFAARQTATRFYVPQNVW